MVSLRVSHGYLIWVDAEGRITGHGMAVHQDATHGERRVFFGCGTTLFGLLRGMGARVRSNFGCLQYALDRGQSQYWEISIKFIKRSVLIGCTG